MGADRGFLGFLRVGGFDEVLVCFEREDYD